VVGRASETLSVVVAAGPRTVAGLLRDSAVAAEALARAGHRFSSPVRLLAPGDRVDLRVRAAPGLRLPVSTVIDAVSATGMSSSLVRGPLRELRHTTVLTAEGAAGRFGTRVHDEISWAGLGPVVDALVLRRLVRGILTARATVLAERAAGSASATVVVATALVRDGRVLAAQRTRPPELAGRWELPGGRVEPGESEADAVVRECREELGTQVCPDGRLGTDLPIDAGLLRVHRARPAPGAAEPRALEHRALRWVGAAELAGIDWVDADRAVLPELAAVLAEPVDD
jgi:8-oxo-dGTP diphosphatase